MVTTYHNRYGDAIKFERVDDNTVEMTGYTYYRAGWSNDYSKAYEAYVNENSNPIPLEEFQERVHDYPTEENPTPNPLKQYQGLIFSSEEYDMVDPSGGPYLSLGMNLSRYGHEDFQIKHISFGENKTIFKNIK